MVLDEADVEPSTELDVESHWDWEHLALFVLGLLCFFVFFYVFRTKWARASNCFSFNDKLHTISEISLH